MKKKLTVWVTALSVVLVVLVALAVFLLFQPRFPQGTELCGVDVSRSFTWTAASRIEERIEDYTLTLSIDGNETSFSAEELSLCLNEEALKTLAQTMQQEIPAEGTSSVLTMDIAPIRALLEQTLPENRVEPEDYRLSWQAGDQVFVLEGGTPGGYNDRELALETVVSGINNLESSIALTEEGYRQYFTDPDKDEAARKALENANGLVSREIVYTYYLRGGEAVQEVIDPARIESWMVIGEDGLTVTWDGEKIGAYAQEMADTYTIDGEGYFLAHDGDEINLMVPMPANVVDTEALSADILSALTDGENGQRETPYSSRNDNVNYDGTYIEISINEQKLWAWWEGELFAETDIVTGCVHCHRDTKTGVFKIENHGRNIYLQGTHFVKYWMAFVIPRYGLHDADGWRTEYGGDIYLTNGSGGCVNVPREVISRIFETYEDGVPVIIYNDTYRLSMMEQEPEADPA